MVNWLVLALPAEEVRPSLLQRLKVAAEQDQVVPAAALLVPVSLLVLVLVVLLVARAAAAMRAVAQEEVARAARNRCNMFRDRALSILRLYHSNR